MPPSYYKEYRDKFMHSNGTTAYETFSVIAPSFFYTIIATTLVSLLKTWGVQSKKLYFILEFFCVVVPIILNVTIFPNYNAELFILFIIFFLTVLFLSFSFKKKFQKSIITKQKCFITTARSTINVMSVIGILAVDFKIFPRRFAKTETFGYSLMDVGVGLFVFSNGIVAPELSRKDSFWKSFKSTIPLLILGSARFIITKEIDYNVPVSEYGVHWNFFITLAVTKLFTSLILITVKVKYIYLNALVLIMAHETILQSGMQNLVMVNTKRNTWFLANKEGIVSSLGYVSLHLFSVYFGYILRNTTSMLKMLSNLIFYSILTLSLSIVLEDMFGISRRLANSSYCFWVLFIGIFMTSLFYIGEQIQKYFFESKLCLVCAPIIYEAINYNGLVFFLLSNLLTGLINMFVDTLTVNSINSLLIIVCYMFVNCLVMFCLFVKQKKIKL